MHKNVSLLTKTAMLLALTVLFQSLRVIIPMPPTVNLFVIGTLVNLSLIVAGVVVGFQGGAAIAILSPVIALMQGHIGNPVLVPFVALGNTVLVAAVALLYRRHQATAIAAGAMAKFAALYLLIVRYAFPVLIAPTVPGPQASKMAALLSYQFSWPQLVTALAGGVLATVLLPLVDRARMSQFR